MNSTVSDFPRSSRLTKHEEFDQVLQHRSQVVRLGCVLAYIKSNTLNTARLGMIVAKKQFPRAIARNRVKRLIRESFRCQRPHLTHVDLVLKVFSGATESRLKGNLDTLWRKLEWSRSTES